MYSSEPCAARLPVLHDLRLDRSNFFAHPEREMRTRIGHDGGTDKKIHPRADNRNPLEGRDLTAQQIGFVRSSSWRELMRGMFSSGLPAS